VIDVLPFDEIEQEFALNFDKRKIDLHVLGLKEILADATREVHIAKKLYKFLPYREG